MASDKTWELTREGSISAYWIDKLFDGLDCVILNPRHPSSILGDMNKHEGELYLSTAGYSKNPQGIWSGDGVTLTWTNRAAWADVGYAAELLTLTLKTASTFQLYQGDTSHEDHTETVP